MIADLPVGTALIAPEPTDETPGRPQLFADPDATRLVKIASPHPDEWPWRRLTGLAGEVPPQGDDLAGWRVQSWTEGPAPLAVVLGHS